MSEPTSRPQLRCRQVMRAPVVTVRDDDSVFVAARTMRENEIGFLPVCDAADRVVGVLTDRDIVLRLAMEDRRASEMPVAEAMTRAVIACELDDPVTDVERAMREHRITRVLVRDSRGAAAGVVSLSDLALYEGAARLAHTLRAVAERKFQPERP